MFSVLRRLVLTIAMSFTVTAQAEDPRIAAELADRTPQVNPLREALGSKLYDEAMASGQYRYIGPRSCRVCHRDFYNGRKDDLHFHTFQKIVDAGHATEPRCLACHSTGYGVPSGFKDERRTPDLAGVHCEGCHGPGNVHMMRNDGGGFLAGVDNPQRIERMCKACHNQRWNRSFDAKTFREMYDKYVTAKPGAGDTPQYNY